jgi:hypothetical protein
LHIPVPQFLHNEHRNILLLSAIQGGTQNDGVYSTFHIIRNRYVIDELIPVQVQVIDHGLLVVQAPFKTFKRFRLLEQVHHCIEI